MNTEQRGSSVLALIPAWNEAARIGRVIAGVLAHLPVLVVDDGSSDGTAEAARAAGADVVCHAENRKKGAALKTGFVWALERGYGAVLTLDADGQHDPADIPRFLQALENGTGDLIIGRRDFSQMPWPRRWSNPFGSWLLSLILGTHVVDSQSGYRLLTRRLLEQLELGTSGFEMEVEMIVEALRLGARVGWVPIRTIYGGDKRSYFHPLKDSARFLQMVWWVWRSQRQGR